MHQWLIMLVFVLVSCGDSGGGNKSGQNSNGPIVDPATGNVRDQLLKLVNDHRSKLGMVRLTYAEPLNVEIQKHTDNMANHVLPLGHLGMGQRCSNAQDELGGGNLCGEIVAQSDAEAVAADVFNQWMNSWGHRAKIEEPRYNKVGIGMSRDFDNDLYSGMLFLEL